MCRLIGVYDEKQFEFYDLVVVQAYFEFSDTHSVSLASLLEF